MPESITRRRISCAGLKDCGTSVHPPAGEGAACGNGAWPAKPFGWSNWRPNDAVNDAESEGEM